VPTNDDQPGYATHLSFNSPLSDMRADTIAGELAARAPELVLDIGCGWAELLLRVLERCDAHGVGVDDDPRALARATANIARRGLAGRVEIVPSLIAAPAAADVVICSGSSQVFGKTATAFAPLFGLVRPGGRLLFGDGFWDPAAAPGDDSVPADMRELPDLPDLVDAAVAAGFRPLRIETATAAEWEAFESRYLADWEEWLLDHPGHPQAAAIQAKADNHRNRWLRGYRHALGYAYLMLARP
jgi:SAM-dependent methyltransferase